MTNMNSEHKRQVRADLCARFGGRCAYCDVPVGLRRGTVDHYIPQALGGTNQAGNLRWACKPCNQAKADMPPEEWELRKPLPVARRGRQHRRLELLQQIAIRGRQIAGGSA